MAPSFDFKKRLGSGYFGEVWLAVDTGLNYECAVKCIPPDKVINQDNFYQEAQTLKAAEHPNIVKVHETGDLDDNRIYVVMEYLKNGSLEDEASGAYVHLSRAKRLMIDVLRGLEYAHSKNIVHRDIKPANILIGDAYEGKLSDFGLALQDIASLNLKSIKQYQYMLHLAPEVEKFDDYNKLSDIYACGMTLYRLVNGDSYLPAIPPQEARAQALKGAFPDRNKYRDFITRPFKTLINKALSVNPDDRFQSAEDMRHALERINVAIDWEESKLSNGKKWLAKKGNNVFEITSFKQKNEKCAVCFKKGRKEESLRRNNKHCNSNLKKAEAQKISRKILQDFVNGKA